MPPDLPTHRSERAPPARLATKLATRGRFTPLPELCGAQNTRIAKEQHPVGATEDLPSNVGEKIGSGKLVIAGRPAAPNGATASTDPRWAGVRARVGESGCVLGDHVLGELL